ncbi:MAG: outer membrane beta-barrel protein [Kiloniellaceae bacterium]
MTKVKALTGLLAAVSLLPALAQADTGPYIGAALGSSHFDQDFNGFVLDTEETAYRFYAGFLLGEFLGIEAGYHNFGDFDRTIDLGGVAARTRLTTDGWSLGATLGTPLTDQLSLFARAGVFVWEVDVQLDGLAVSVPGNENPFYGGGAKVDFTPNLSLIGDWTRYELDPIHSDVVSIGLQYRFGK